MRVLSGIQPTGTIHLGNYLGAIKQFLTLQEQADCYFCIVNLHSLTMPRSPEELRTRTLDVAALYLACGLDPNKVTLFVQSDVHAHSEAGWLLQCVTRIGELNRMIQFKEKSKGSDAVVAGLYTYPVLQAADILLYQATHVPVGEDQKQHLELTRLIANRFNRDYDDIFTLPEPIIGQTVMGLDNPNKKMSKSAESEYNYISLLDDENMIAKKMKKAVTDSENEIRFDLERKAGLSNLLVIYHMLSDQPLTKIVEDYGSSGYGPFKKDLIELMISVLIPIRERFQEIRHSEKLVEVLQQGAEKANFITEQTLVKMQQAMGIIWK